MIPNVMQLSLEEVNARIKWLECEIHLLSTSSDVSARLQDYQICRGQLQAAKAIMRAMHKQPHTIKKENHDQKK